MIGLARLAYRAYLAFEKDDGTALAGYIAFSALLGLFPFLILAVNISAALIGPENGQQAVDVLFEVLPPHVAQTLEPVVRDVLEGSSGGVLTASALAALWFSSNAVEALRVAFDRAYGADAGRHWLIGRLISIVCVLVGIVVALLVSVSIVLAPLLLGLAERFLDQPVPVPVYYLRYVVGLAVVIGYLIVLHRILPRHGATRRPLWPGVLVSTLIWVLAATAFSIYLGFTPTYVSTYGALAGVVITLMFFYITGIAFIYGATFNAVLHGRRVE